MDSKEIRSKSINEAIDKLGAITGEDFHGYRSEVYRILSALSIIDPEAIKRECADRLCDNCPILNDYYAGRCIREPSQCGYRAAILATEPVQNELQSKSVIRGIEIQKSAQDKNKCFKCDNWDKENNTCAESNVMSTPGSSWYSCHEYSNFKSTQDSKQ